MADVLINYQVIDSDQYWKDPSYISIKQDPDNWGTLGCCLVKQNTFTWTVRGTFDDIRQIKTKTENYWYVSVFQNTKSLPCQFCHAIFLRLEGLGGVHCGNVEVKNKTYILLFQKGDLLTVFVLVFILRELTAPIFLVYILNNQASPFKSESKYRTNICIQGYCFRYQVLFSEMTHPFPQ